MPKTPSTSQTVVALSSLVACLGLVPVSVMAQATAPRVVGAGSGAGLSSLGVGLPSEPRDGLSFGVRSTFLYSNNIDLQPDSQVSGGDGLLEVAPSARLRLNAQRGPVSVDYTVRAQVRSGSDDNFRLRNELRASTDLRLIDQWLRISALAFVRSVNLNPFSATSVDPSSQVSNTGQYRNLELSPYMLGSLGGDSTWTVRYRLRHIDGGQLSVLPFVFAGANTQHILSAGLRTDLERRMFGMSLDATRADVQYRNGLDYINEEYDLLGWWRANSSLRVGAGLGYASNDRLVNSQGVSSGSGAVAALNWNPGGRTNLQARWADRYYGEQITFSADHRGANWVVRLAHSEGIQDGNSANLSLTALQRAVAAELQRIGIDPATLPGLQGSPAAIAAALSDIGLQFNGALNTPLVYFTQSNLTLALQGARTAVQVGLFTSDRRSAIANLAGGTPSIDQYGGNLSATYRLDASQALNAGVSHLRSRSASAALESTRNTLIGSWDWRLSPRLVVSIGARLQKQTGSGTGVVEFDEAAGFVAADYRLD